MEIGRLTIHSGKAYREEGDSHYWFNYGSGHHFYLLSFGVFGYGVWFGWYKNNIDDGIKKL